MAKASHPHLSPRYSTHPVQPHNHTYLVIVRVERQHQAVLREFHHGWLAGFRLPVCWCGRGGMGVCVSGGGWGGFQPMSGGQGVLKSRAGSLRPGRPIHDVSSYRRYL